ncbi:MAG: hypothetical protein HXX14_06395 [Bacteroidetes bacterium]|nr:hypothetical protein [Bacteroidota bacterium]
MKKTALITLLFLSIFIIRTNAQTTNIDQVFNNKFKGSLISSDDNFPDFAIGKDSMNLLLISLHKNFDISEFKSKTKFSATKLDSIIHFLEGKNYIHRIGNQYKPTVFIADTEEVINLYKYALPISKEIVKTVKESLPSIKEKFTKSNIAQTLSFEDWSFYILSNVLIDYGQIENVEREFLKTTSRPQRNGKYYYLSLIESNDKNEPVGIYGKQMGAIHIYGNNSIGLKVIFAENKISVSDGAIFSKIAKDFLPHLLEILERNRKYAENIYKEMGYSKEITFDEFYIWWFHFIYTKATNLMTAERMLKVSVVKGNIITQEEN